MRILASLDEAYALFPDDLLLLKLRLPSSELQMDPMLSKLSPNAADRPSSSEELASLLYRLLDPPWTMFFCRFRAESEDTDIIDADWPELKESSALPPLLAAVDAGEINSDGLVDDRTLEGLLALPNDRNEDVASLWYFDAMDRCDDAAERTDRKDSEASPPRSDEICSDFRRYFSKISPRLAFADATALLHVADDFRRPKLPSLRRRSPLLRPSATSLSCNILPLDLLLPRRRIGSSSVLLAPRASEIGNAISVGGGTAVRGRCIFLPPLARSLLSSFLSRAASELPLRLLCFKSVENIRSLLLWASPVGIVWLLPCSSCVAAAKGLLLL